MLELSIYLVFDHEQGGHKKIKADADKPIILRHFMNFWEFEMVKKQTQIQCFSSDSPPDDLSQVMNHIRQFNVLVITLIFKKKKSQIL